MTSDTNPLHRYPVHNMLDGCAYSNVLCCKCIPKVRLKGQKVEKLQSIFRFGFSYVLPGV